MPEKSKAFLFDLNGTMVDDMDYHIRAWHGIFNSMGRKISLEEMKKECYGKNNELIERIFPGRYSTEQKESMSIEKENNYQVTYKKKLKLLDGLENFIKANYREGVKMAIGTAAIRSNVDFVLDLTGIKKYFGAIVSAEDVKCSKPDPETFLKCAMLLGVLPEDCIVFEDTPKGVESAVNAKMNYVVVTTSHTADEFSRFPGALCYCENFSSISLNYLLSDYKISQ